MKRSYCSENYGFVINPWWLTPVLLKSNKLVLQTTDESGYVVRSLNRTMNYEAELKIEAELS